MAHQDLLDYIQKSRQMGASDEAIKKMLLEHGWDAGDVATAFGPASPAIPSNPFVSPGALSSVGATTASTSSMLGAKILVALLLVIGAGGAGYAYYNARKLPLMTPQEVMQKMREAGANTTSLAYSMKLDATVTANDLFSPKNSASMDMDFDAITPTKKAPELQTGHYSLNVTGATEAMKHTKPLESLERFQITGEGDYAPSQKFAFDVEMRQSKKDLYGIVHKIGLPPLLNLSTEWVHVNLETIFTDLGLTDLQAEYDKALNDSQLSTEQQKKLIALLRDADILAVTKTFDMENIDGEQYYHYAWNVDKEKLKKVIPEFASIIMEYSQFKLKPEEKAMMQLGLPMITGYIDPFPMPTGEIWVNAKTFMPLKHTFHYVIDDKALDLPEPFNVTLTGELTTSKYNEPVVVEVPAGAKSLDEIITQYAGPDWKIQLKALDSLRKQSQQPPFPSDELSADEYSERTMGYEAAKLKARDARRIADVKGYQTALALYFEDTGAYTPASQITKSLGLLDETKKIACGSTDYYSPMPHTGADASDFAYSYKAAGSVVTKVLSPCAKNGRSKYVIEFALEGDAPESYRKVGVKPSELGFKQCKAGPTGIVCSDKQALIKASEVGG